MSFSVKIRSTLKPVSRRSCCDGGKLPTSVRVSEIHSRGNQLSVGLHAPFQTPLAYLGRWVSHSGRLHEAERASFHPKLRIQGVQRLLVIYGNVRTQEEAMLKRRTMMHSGKEHWVRKRFICASAAASWTRNTRKKTSKDSGKASTA